VFAIEIRVRLCQRVRSEPGPLRLVAVATALWAVSRL